VVGVEVAVCHLALGVVGVADMSLGGLRAFLAYGLTLGLLPLGLQVLRV